MHIEALLFDADGVIQTPPDARRSKWAEILGSGRNVDEFLADIFAAELAAAEGESDFTEALSNVLSRWKCTGTLADAFDAWTMIDADAGIVETIRTLRATGTACYLATNQEPYRARYMSETLGYESLFDREFYSCRIGVRKPKGAYFQTILNQIGIPANRVLFLDDHQANVDSAREVGLHAAVFNLNDGREAMHRTLREFGIRIA